MRGASGNMGLGFAACCPGEVDAGKKGRTCRSKNTVMGRLERERRVEGSFACRLPRKMILVDEVYLRLLPKPTHNRIFCPRSAAEGDATAGAYRKSECSMPLFAPTPSAGGGHPVPDIPCARYRTQESRKCAVESRSRSGDMKTSLP